ncbi:MAG: twin-arginine translocase subunit TatC [Phycisphaerales bacterium]
MLPHDRDPDDEGAPPPGGVMTFGEHLEELRRRLIRALAVPLPLAILAFVFADSIRAVITAPLYSALEAQKLPTQVQALSPVETLTTDLFLAVILALVLSAPWLVYQLWKFVEPGLYANERRFARFLMPSSAILVAIGLSVLYWIMLPLMLLFLVGFGQPGPTETFPVGGTQASAATEPSAEDSPPAEARDASPSEEATTPSIEATNDGDATAAPTGAPRNLATLPILDAPPSSLQPGDAWIDESTAQIRVAVPAGDGLLEIRSVALARDRSLMPAFRLREYVDFVLLLALAISIAFQMPLVILLLGWVGIVEVPTLRRNRKYAFLACAVLAAIMTPPDFVSMFLLLGPLYGLYELGILLLVLLPPESLSRGSVMHDALDRIRRWRRRDGDSTTNAGGETPSSAAMPPPPGAVPRGSSFEREPDGDADEDRASTSSDFGGIDPASRDQGASPDEPDRDERGDEPRKPWP